MSEIPPPLPSVKKGLSDEEFAAWKKTVQTPMVINESGAKKEVGGKRSAHAVDAEAVCDLSDHMLKNALLKYGLNNYSLGMRMSQIVDAAESHLRALRRGEMVDPETGDSHVEALGAAWLMLNTCRRRGTLVNDALEVYVDAMQGSRPVDRADPAVARTPFFDASAKTVKK